VFVYHDAFNPETAEVDDLKARYRAGKVGRRRGQDQAREGAERLSRSDPRAPRRGSWRSRAREGDPARGSKKARRVAAETMARRARGREVEVRLMEQEFESILEAYPGPPAELRGPLDLLLHLIKRNEVSIYDIPITSSRAVHRVHRPDAGDEPRRRGEFLVMAATLIHIKSRELLPRPDPAQEDPEEDPREALMRRLLEHQKFKAAAELLHERETLRSAQWTRPDGPIAEMAARRRSRRSRSISSA
jgi:hypothetical protein